MDEETRKKILDWIFKNHNHHKECWCGNDSCEHNCYDADFPYVNSLELEKFIKKLK